jgi:peptide/nickel transport system substrate-binding protein
MISKQRVLIGITLTLFCSLILFACGSPQSAAAPSVAEVAEAEEPAAAYPEPTVVQEEQKPVQQKPKEQKPLIIAVAAGPKELDPDFGETTIKGNVLRQLFNMPTWFNEKGETIPSVFESWEVINEGKTWRFKIRQGAKFWSGSPINAETVKYTFDRMVSEDILDAGGKNAFPMRVGLVGTEVVDEYTIDVHTEEPNNLVPLRLYVVFLLDPSHYETAPLSETASKPAGSGPYKLVEFVPDDHITIVANDDYWMGKPEIETIIFKIVPERSSRIAMLETGEADIALDLAPDDMALVESIPGVRVSWIEGSQRIGLHINQSMPYLRDKRVRQALNHAVNWDVIKDSLLGGMGSRLVTYRGGELWANPNLSAYRYDPEKAKQLLEEANFPMDQKLIIDVTSANPVRSQICQVIASQWADIGLKVEVNILEDSVLTQSIFDRKTNDMVALGFGGRGNPIQDASTFNADAWNMTGWEDEKWLEAEELRKQISSSFDEEEQKRLSQQLEALVYEEAPWVFLYRDLVIAGVSERVDWDVRNDGHLFLYYAGWAD